MGNYKIIKKTVEEMGGKFKEIDSKRYAGEITYKNKKFIITSKFVIRSSILTTTRLTSYKDLTYSILSKNKIKTPKTLLVTAGDNLGKVKKEIAKMKCPLVVKDAEGSKSKGVFVNIKSHKEALALIKKMLDEYNKLVVQEMIQGNEYRVLILDRSVLGVLRLIPPYIIGNGRTKTLNLIQKKQKTTSQKTPQDKFLKKLLKEQDENLNSVPVKEKKIFLRRNCCLAEGGISVDATNKIGSWLSEICFKAVKLTGLKLAGIDLLCQDISGEKSKDYSIIEINGKPDIDIHYEPTKGKPREVARKILNYIAKL